MRKAVSCIGEELFPLYLEVQRADMLAQSSYKREQKEARIRGVEDIYRQIQTRGDCVSLKGLALGGRDLIKAGIAPGPGLGEILNALLEKVLDEPYLNRRETLLKLALEMQAQEPKSREIS